MNISTIKDYAWMSQASYLGLEDAIIGNPESLRNQLTGDTFDSTKQFAQAQAAAFTDTATGYALINHRPNTSTGFSATLFASNAGAGYTIAVRGTEPGNDFISDLLRADGLGVVLTGQAVEQLIDAYRYYKQLTSAAASSIYSEAEITKLVQLYKKTPEAILLTAGGAGGQLLLESKALLFGNALRQDAGLNLIPAGSAINFTGHSLGGHVAALLAELVAQFDGVGRVGDIVTYNAPGFDKLTDFAWMPQDDICLRKAA